MLCACGTGGNIGGMTTGGQSGTSASGSASGAVFGSGATGDAGTSSGNPSSSGGAATGGGGSGSTGSGLSTGSSSGGGSGSSSGGSGGSTGTGSGSAGGGSGLAGSGSSGVGNTGGPPLVTQFDTNCLSVPDPDIAASDTLVGMVGQWTAYFYKKDGTADHQYTWTAAQGSLVSDTHIVYDKPSKRWFLTTIVNLGNNNFGTQIMVSGDATASSWKASVPAKQIGLIDNPQPTVTSDKVLIVFHGHSAWVVDKADLYGGNAAVVQPTSTTLPAADNWVAVKYGGDPPSVAYAITLIDQTTLGWISVDGTNAANNVTLKVNMITVPRVDSYPFGQSLFAATANGATYENGEVKAMAQNGHIYWAKTTTCGNSLCERLYDVDTATNTAKTTDFSMANNQMWFGVPGVDKYENVWMLATASTTRGPLGLALMGVYASGKVYDATNILMGKAQVGRGMVRMGDYASAAQDPTDGSVWLIGSYGATNPNPLNRENNLGCRAVHVTPQ